MSNVFVGSRSMRNKLDKLVSKDKSVLNNTCSPNDYVLAVLKDISKGAPEIVKLNTENKSGIGVITKSFKLHCDRSIKELSINKKGFYNFLQGDYHGFRKFFLDECYNSTKSFDKQYLGRCIDFFDNYYCIIHSKHFAMSIKDIEKLVSDTPEDLSDITDEDLQNICDMTIDIMVGKDFIPITIKVLKTTYTVDVNGDNKEVYNVALLTYKPGDKSTVGSIVAFSFMLDMYPRIYVSPSNSLNRCSNCDLANRKKYNIYTKPDDDIQEVRSITDIEYCMVGARKASMCACNDTIIFKESVGTKIDIPLDSVTIMKIIAHVVRTYKNRNSIIRKNTRHKELKEKAVRAISIPKEGGNEESILTMRDYVQYERREKYEWQGGHHSSPIEHERKGHVRRYRDKDGNIIKEVIVRGTTVNKGGKKGIYIVK